MASWRRQFRGGRARFRSGLATVLAAALLVGNGAAMWPACCRTALAAKSDESAPASCCARHGVSAEPQAAPRASADRDCCRHRAAPACPLNNPAPADPCCCLEAPHSDAAILVNTASVVFPGGAPLAELPGGTSPRAERASESAPILLADLSALERCERLCRWRN